MPCEAVQFHQAARYAGQIGNHGFMLEFVNRQRQGAWPSNRDKGRNRLLVRRDYAPRLAHGEICGEAGNTNIQGAAAAANDAGVGKQQINETQILDVIRDLVVDALRIAVLAKPRHVEIHRSLPILRIQIG